MHVFKQIYFLFESIKKSLFDSFTCGTSHPYWRVYYKHAFMVVNVSLCDR